MTVIVDKNDFTKILLYTKVNVMRFGKAKMPSKRVNSYSKQQTANSKQ